MRGIRSISGPRKILNVWFVPRRPHPARSAKYAFVARLCSGGANNKNGQSPEPYQANPKLQALLDFCAKTVSRAQPYTNNTYAAKRSRVQGLDV